MLGLIKYKVEQSKAMVPILFFVCLLFSVTSCGTSNSTTPSTNSVDVGNINNVSYIAPNIIPSLIGASSRAYLVVTNESDEAVSNISYQITNAVGGGSSVTIESDSAAACSTAAAGGQCILTLIVPPSVQAGAFSVSASNIAGSTPVKSNLIGVEQASYNTQTGPNGITLYYSNTVVAGTPYVLVTGLVASESVGTFNSVEFIDTNDNPLPNQQVVSGNLGNGLSALPQGSTFAILIPVPAASDTSTQLQPSAKNRASNTASNANQLFYTQTSFNAADGTKANIQTGSTINVLNVVSTSQAVIEVLPLSLVLSESNPSQTLMIVNNSAVPATSLSLSSSSSNVTVDFSTSTLAPQTVAQATISLVDVIGAVSNSDLNLEYNDGVNDLSQLIAIEQNLTPPLSPIAYAGLSLKLVPSNQFISSQLESVTSNFLLLTNTGNTNESNFIISGLPNGFSLSNGASANPCIVSDGIEITNTLTTSGSSQSCDVQVTHASQTVTPLTQASLAVNYDFDIDVSPVSAIASQISFYYEVKSSSANLAIVPNDNTDFGTIVNNNIAVESYVFTLVNSGTGTAENIDLNNSSLFSGTNANLFTLNTGASGVTNPCSNSLDAGESCQLGVTFGPTLEAAVDATASLAVTYYQFTGAVAPVTTAGVDLTGTVATAQSAIINIAQVSSSGFVTGNGTPSLPYLIQESTAGVLNYTLTNTGTVPATNFYTTLTSNLPVGWTASNSTCGSITGPTTLNANGGSCQISFTLNSNNPGPNNLNLGLLDANWSDQHSVTNTQNFSGTTTHVSIFAAPSIGITTTPSPLGQIAQGGSFVITASLSGGYSGTASQIINAATTASGVSFTNNNCVTSGSIPSCDITVNVAATGASLTNNVVNMSNTTSGGPVPSPSSITFNVLPESASITLESYTYADFPEPNGNGESTNPLYIYIYGGGYTGTITYIFTNSGKVAATGVFIDVYSGGFTPTNGWSFVPGQNTCGVSNNKVTLNPGSTCNVAFVTNQYMTLTDHAYNLNLSFLSFWWTDQAGGHSQTYPNITTYVSTLP